PVIRRAEVVNEHKTALVAEIGTYRRLASKRERDSHQVRDLLIRLGYARLNLVQTYRKIPILEQAPTRIGFTWILGTKHVETVNREEAMRRLPGDVERSGSDLARIRQEVMEARRSGLRLVRPVAPHMRANVVWLEKDQRRTACIHAPLPILYRYSSRSAEPVVVGHDRPEPDPKSMPARQRRNDANLRSISGTIDVYRAD
ncbi:MAG TPA: DNA replication terminus site-binding protein, partial [Vicinamibacterales bacterium]|nr:DNA replication terminus site-binding protein [Vicinamibacterales bacterium]